MKSVFPFYSIGHFINQPQSKTSFEVLRFEEMEEPEVDDVHKHSFYEILWTEAGTSRQTIDYVEYEVKPYSLFFISPGQVHQFEAWKPLTGGTILFTEEFFLLNHYDKNKILELSFLDNTYVNPCLQFGKKAFAEVREIIDLICREHRRAHPDPSIQQSLLHVLLALAQRFVDASSDHTGSRKYMVIYKNFKRLLEDHFSENLTAQFYATALNVTSHHLNLVVKAVTGNTATDVIRARSILEAKRFLSFTDMTIAEVATELNYFDSSYFAKTFRKSTGFSPAAFKSKMSEKYRI
jgi:AraC family transcriptional regulator, transcriptional activator of pobA